MIAGLQRRLRKVESLVPPWPSAEMCKFEAFIAFGVAYYLGDSSPHEETFPALARALGYADEAALNAAMIEEISELDKRFLFAKIKLFTRFGLKSTQDGGNDEIISEGLKKIEDGLSKSYKVRLKKALARTDVNIAWVSDNADVASFLRIFA